MEDCNNKGEVHANFTKQPLSRSVTTLKSTLTPRRESKGGAQRFGSNRLLLWLFLITLWAYLGFCVQSRWAHDDKEEEFSGFESRPRDTTNSHVEQNQHHDLIAKNISLSVNIEIVGNKTMDVALAKKEYGVLSQLKASSRKRRRRSMRALRGKRKRKHRVESSGIEEQEPGIPQGNATYGFLVGPFGSIEDRILQWGPRRRYETCVRNGDFVRLVRSRRFVLIFHELSMTGAPLSMMELATELLSCGASISAVVLSRKGGLMQELARRQIKVLEDKAYLSFKTSIKADLVIAGSAVCASWIEQYIEHFPAGASQVAWWIMENRREYFDRAKDVLHRVKILVFLSESQSKQWQKWCEEGGIKLRSQPALVPLSVNDELAFVAGMPSTVNTPPFSAEKMDERRKLLRDSIRREMGLTDNDMLVMTLSSINRGKGQLLLLESASSIVEHGPLQHYKKMPNSSDDGEYLSTLARKHHIRKLLKESSVALNNISSNFINRREVLSHNDGTMAQTLKILIGSVGSKSNKVDYVKGLLSILAKHSNMSKSVLWTSATTRVASLYSAADVYVINSQGLGETFGRVTIEAMAFGLPVLGTDAGGTQEIVEHNVTGLLHPIGRPGNHVLAQNLRFLLENRLAREQMGIEGRKKVQRMFLKQHMYEKFVEVLVMCMRSK
ncbi:N-acetyl-alpha-D-glucosaminyl L-malate synthase [Spatholobus suberectus]|nr:N-acetyl-alpha-D-glucosaminyl L-malate synthase [Spatholobus suberectus]